jgi:hypothetical protein
MSDPPAASQRTPVGAIGTQNRAHLASVQLVTLAQRRAEELAHASATARRLTALRRGDAPFGRV